MGREARVGKKEGKMWENEKWEGFMGINIS